MPALFSSATAGRITQLLSAQRSTWLHLHPVSATLPDWSWPVYYVPASHLTSLILAGGWKHSVQRSLRTKNKKIRNYSRGAAFLKKYSTAAHINDASNPVFDLNRNAFILNVCRLTDLSFSHRKVYFW